jgi:transketolase
MADAIRVLSMDAVGKAKSGHLGAPMGLADVATVLWSRFLKFDAAKPDWIDRDRFVLSAGHGSMLIYALLHLTGVKAVTRQELEAFRQWGSKTPGHPEFGHTPGVETTTGPLGQGLATAVGMAMAERSMAARYGEDLIDHRTWVMAGDGCLMEGVSHEAISLAARLKLSKLTVIWDDNDATIDGKVGMAEVGDQMARFKAAGWAVKAVDGHDMGALRRAMAWAIKQDRPSLIAAKTKIGKGSANFEGNPKTHGVLDAAEIAASKAKLGWTAEPFAVPEEIETAWRKVGRRGAKLRRAWEAKIKASPQGQDLIRAAKGDLPKSAFDALQAHIAKAVADKPDNATRVHSGAALEALIPSIPEMIGGSADLTGSNNTITTGMKPFDAPDYAGRYVHYGVREFGMAAAMNGMALHGGIIPYSGTFLVFSDYSRPAIRLGALMGARVIHVMTHDSIGLGEDGPTHQPVEHLASLRALPGLLVMRPADAVETAECWQCALGEKTMPTVMALSRQKVPAVRTVAAPANLSAQGAYELASSGLGEARVSLFASGSEVSIAMAARDLLQAQGIGTRVVSTPCWELFDRQSAKVQAAVIGKAKVRVAVEAAVRLGWERFIGEDGGFVGMSSFGASAPYEKLYEAFGITAQAVANAALAKL